MKKDTIGEKYKIVHEGHGRWVPMVARAVERGSTLAGAYGWWTFTCDNGETRYFTSKRAAKEFLEWIRSKNEF